ncbi:hypothetical protein [Paracraurococcus ruber]|uniref:DUF3325 domain-containing protein n=1 Tax=Paracraurococcus ruber TaxID=77675 RepID=A0ABS1CTU3_9PROT|nr:hypothetical protein [Paracraurococcus ruber]MBK1657900.1 hypothetical protein [Paracraurococcus ruber]TDG32455.1 hypothetical protein E2C05_07140 [Paracraurococcus ruber]
MQVYFLALVALSIAGVIEARSTTPGLRPEAAAADRAFRIMGRSAFAFWLVLLAWGVLEMHWTQPLAGLILSLAANALVVQAGARPWWPGISMGLALLGLFLTAVVLTR